MRACLRTSSAALAIVVMAVLPACSDRPASSEISNAIAQPVAAAPASVNAASTTAAPEHASPALASTAPPAATAAAKTQAVKPERQVAAARTARASKSTAVQQPPDPSQSVPVGGSVELGAGPPPPRVLPSDPKELLALFTNDSNEVKSLLDQGMFTAVWKPAIDTKDDALALDDHSSNLPANQRVVLDDAVHRLMLAAWQLDSFGDLGDKQKLLRAYNAFAAAVQDVKAVYASVH